MNKKNKKLLERYMLGFNDELNNKPELFEEDELLKKAYNLGRLDALIGDDITSSDYQSEQSILKRINKI
jgi:hypothetical protein